MFAAAVFEVFQYSTFELENLIEALTFHVGASLFAADSARAKHHDWLVLEFGGQPANSRREASEMFDAECYRVLECAELHFVIVSRIEQRNRSSFVEPTFKLARSELRRGSLGWIDAPNPEGDDFPLDADQHAVERLFVADANFGPEIRQPRYRPQLVQQQIDLVAAAGHEYVNSLGAE